jgi:hypothetical protein
MIVQKSAPTKPSTVFLGESAISGVRPMVTPQMYAKMSLQMTREAGTQNQMRPSRMLLTMKWLLEDYEYVSSNHKHDAYLEMTMSKSVMCTQQNSPNCCLRYPRLREATKPTKPIVYNTKLMNRCWFASIVKLASTNTMCCSHPH